MSNIVKPRHPDCRDCRFFNPTRANARCLPCGNGEFFEERVYEMRPDENELMKMFANMTGYNNDD